MLRCCIVEKWLLFEVYAIVVVVVVVKKHHIVVGVIHVVVVVKRWRIFEKVVVFYV